MAVFTNVFLYFSLCLLAYFIGAIPTGYIFSKLFFNVSITEAGSGNIGASNVGRVLGKRYFLIILFIDACKAYGTLAAATALAPELFASPLQLTILIAGLLVGNAYSIFLRFSGGKGVATIAGILAFIAPWAVFALFAMLWLTVLAITKEPFIASISAMLAVTTWGLLWVSTDLCIVLIALFLWVLLRHTSNIMQWQSKICSSSPSKN